MAVGSPRRNELDDNAFVGAPAPHGGDGQVAGSAVALPADVDLAETRRGLLRRALSYQNAPLAGVAVLLAAGTMHMSDVQSAGRVVWPPLLVISSIMIITASAQRLGVLEQIAAGIFPWARGSAVRLFFIAFCLSAGTAAILNNDSAVLLLIPIVVALTRLLYPDRPAIVLMFAFVVFMAAGVAPFVVSNPMNLIVAQYAGMNFNTYAIHMIPVTVSGWVVAFVVLRWLFRAELRSALPPTADPPSPPAWTPSHKRGLALLLVVIAAYPVAAWLRGPNWAVAAPGAVAFVLLVWRSGAGQPLDVVRRGVAWDILVFLAGVSTVAIGLANAGLVDWLGRWYRETGLVGIGATSAAGSALINNHPMSLLNVLAIHPHRGAHLRPILAALVGGDLGPRLLPWGSLAGLLWFSSLRRLGVRPSVRRFVQLGALVTLVSLPVSLLVLYLTS